jgi:DNA-binding transcriptional ArsR family regulator
MQGKLPFFPPNTKMITSWVGFCERDGTVYYLHCGNPIFCHSIDDHKNYRFILANLVVNKLCTISELCTALGERRRNIERYVKAYRDHGSSHFFERKDERGHCYKMTPEKLAAIQIDLDEGISIYRIALTHNISEAAVSYHIKKGNLKKKL